MNEDELESRTQPPSEMQTRSSRDLEAVRRGLQQALAGYVAHGSDHRVGELAGTSSNGLSSETLLFDASWTEPAGPRFENLVARVAPMDHDVPVFPNYDLPGQFRTIETVAALTDVPVPPAWWCEPDPAVIGSPFFVMGRVDGEVPPDLAPYNFGGNWLFDGTPDQRARLQESSISVLARLHAIEAPEQRFAHLVGGGGGDTPLRRHVAKSWNWYQFAARDSGRSELLEKGFAWLADHWPAHESSAVFCWGDARIGNILYRDFEPAAVLDWEMAGLAPPETDLGWMLYLHRMFEDLARMLGLPGMPDFLRPEDAAQTYERLTGRTPRDLEWYVNHACLQLGIVGLRTGARSVRFGERPAPERTDELLLNEPAIAALVGA